MSEYDELPEDFDPYEGLPAELRTLLEQMAAREEHPERPMKYDIRVHLTARTSCNTGATNEEIEQQVTLALENYFASNIGPDEPFTHEYNCEIEVVVTDDDVLEPDAA